MAGTIERGTAPARHPRRWPWVLAAAVIALGIAIGIAAVIGQHGTAKAAPQLPLPSAATAPTAPAATEANPVNILRRAGASIPQGTISGEVDLYGDRYADGNFYGPGCTAADNCSERITVRMVHDRSQLSQYQDTIPSDSNAVIMGPGEAWYITVTPVDDVMNGGGYVYFTSPQVIAQRVHGTLLTRNG